MAGAAPASRGEDRGRALGRIRRSREGNAREHADPNHDRRPRARQRSLHTSRSRRPRLPGHGRRACKGRPAARPRRIRRDGRSPAAVVARGIPQPKKRESRHDYQWPPSHAGCNGRPGGARRRGKGHLVRCVLFARVRAYSRTSNDLGQCLAAYPDRRCGCLDPRGRSSEVHEYLEWRCSQTRRTRPTPIGCLLRATRGCAAPHAPGAAATAWPRRAP
jgi:hypothetical protein